MNQNNFIPEHDIPKDEFIRTELRGGELTLTSEAVVYNGEWCCSSHEDVPSELKIYTGDLTGSTHSHFWIETENSIDREAYEEVRDIIVGAQCYDEPVYGLVSNMDGDPCDVEIGRENGLGESLIPFQTDSDRFYVNQVLGRLAERNFDFLSYFTRVEDLDEARLEMFQNGLVRNPDYVCSNFVSSYEEIIDDYAELSPSFSSPSGGAIINPLYHPEP